MTQQQQRIPVTNAETGEVGTISVEAFLHGAQAIEEAIEIYAQEKQQTESLSFVFHVFSHSRDHRFSLSACDLALTLYREWVEAHGSSRLYLEAYRGEPANEHLYAEDCLLYYGDYPW